MARLINFDHAAATQLLPEVVEKMKPYLFEIYGNPSSLHGEGQKVKAAIDDARAQVAQLINAETEEIVFTASGSESNNFALKGVALANLKKGNHIVISAIEHFSVMQAAKSLTKSGFEISHVPVDANGLVNPEDVKNALTDQTILVSVMHANHEVGTIQPLAEISQIVKERGILLHTDAVQTAGVIPVDVKALDVDFLSLSAQTFYGPKGVAALYIKNRSRINPLIDGGTQEGGRRAGTENVMGIIGMGAAAEIARLELPVRQEKLTALRDSLIGTIETKVPHVYLHGHRTQRLPNNVNFGFEFIEGESILLFLGMKGVVASSGSACTSKALKASHVLTSMGVSHALANGTILFTLGIDNSEADIQVISENLPQIVERLRSMSPLYNQ